MEKFTMPDGFENMEGKKRSFAFVDPTNIEPVPFAVIEASDEDEAVRLFEQETGMRLENNPNIVIATENDDEQLAA